MHFSFSQEIKTEIEAPATPHDAKPNSDSVPDVYAMTGQFERVVILRLKNKADLLAGLEQGVKENNIKNAVILAGIGSVTSYHYHVVNNRNFPTKNLFVKNNTAPADFVSMNGYIINGRVHAHAVFTSGEKAFGGHLEPGTSVYTFAIITLGVLSDTTDPSRVDNKDYR